MSVSHFPTVVTLAWRGLLPLFCLLAAAGGPAQGRPRGHTHGYAHTRNDPICTGGGSLRQSGGAPGRQLPPAAPRRPGGGTPGEHEFGRAARSAPATAGVLHAAPGLSPAIPGLATRGRSACPGRWQPEPDPAGSPPFPPLDRAGRRRALPGSPRSGGPGLLGLLPALDLGHHPGRQ